MSDILYFFISHNKVIVDDYRRISEMMSNLNYNHYCIVYGGEKLFTNENVIHIDCDDSWCGLPEKVNKAYKYFNTEFDFTHVIKMDRTARVKQLIPTEEIKDVDYAGIPIMLNSKTYHFNRCSKDSKWHNKPFNGHRISYCLGPGYILSKKAVEYISKDNDYQNHIYEDYHIGYILLKHSILPKRINMRQYVEDTGHVQFK